ncbi:hypothetical protein BVY04_04840 [bacterium M21]|nr:hypothetical protein BVY04_04840 [bacterium M21]
MREWRQFQTHNQIYMAGFLPLHRRLFWIFFVLCLYLFPETEGTENGSVALMLTDREKEWLKEHPVVRLGVDPDYPPFEFIDENGQYSGIAPEYLKLIGQKLGVKFEVVKGLTWTQVVEGVKTDSVDVIPVMTPTDERRKFVNFTSGYLLHHQVIITRKDYHRVEGLSDFKGRLLTVTKGYQTAQEVSEKYPGIKLLERETPLEELKAVSSGLADGCQGNMAGLGYLMQKHNLLNLKVAAPCVIGGSGAMAIAVRKDWPLLHSALDKALMSVPESARVTFRQKWVPGLEIAIAADRQSQGKKRVELNQEEREWITQHPVIRVVLDPDWAPVEFMDEDGEYHGMSLDYLSQLEELIGVKFEICKGLKWQEAISRVQQKEADMFVSVAKTAEREQFAVFTETYTTMPINIFARSDVSYVGNLRALHGKKVAVIGGYAIHDWLKRDYPEIELVPVQSIPIALGALERGKVYAFVGNVVTTSYYIGKFRKYDIRVAGETEYQNNQCMAVRNDWSILAGILQKGLDAISISEKDSIYNRWMAIKYEHGFNYSLLWKYSFIVALVLVAFIAWNWQLRLSVEAKTSELRHYQAHLENLVQERTQKLEKSMEEAQAANRSKSEFLANMSHEIRTPMNAVLGFAEILKTREINPQKLQYIDAIYTSGKALLSLINDILDLSKVEAGKLELQYSAVSLERLFDEINTIFAGKIQDKGVAFSMELASNIPETLLLDEVRVRQVLINLIGNAHKFTERGFIRLSASVNSLGSTVALTLTVTDSGIGIRKEQQDNIFGAFEQTKGQKVRQFGGTGLGLAISRRLVELMGGHLTVESEAGIGSTFTLNLPGVEVAAGDLEQRTGTPDFDHIIFEPVKVLVVDDIDFNRDILRTFLEGQEITIFEAEDGKTALAQTYKQHPDLILLDMRMPAMDGYEVAKRLRDDESMKDIPIIAVTASALKRDEEIISSLCDGYLRKPVSKNELIGELMKHLAFSETETTMQSFSDAVVSLSIDDLELLVNQLDVTLKERVVTLCMTGDIAKLEECLKAIENRPLRHHLEAQASQFNYQAILDLLRQETRPLIRRQGR